MDDFEIETIAKVYQILEGYDDIDPLARAYLIGLVESVLRKYRVDPNEEVTAPRRLTDLFRRRRKG